MNTWRKKNDNGLQNVCSLKNMIYLGHLQNYVHNVKKTHTQEFSHWFGDPSVETETVLAEWLSLSRTTQAQALPSQTEVAKDYQTDGKTRESLGHML